MRLMTVLPLGFLLLLLPSPGALAASSAPLTLEGQVTAVTVYQGQALITRTVKLEGVEGLIEVVVTNLPESVLPASLYAEPGSGVTIRSVRYRVRPVEADVREEVRQLDAEIEATQDAMNEVAVQQKLLRDHIAYLQQLEQFTAVAANQELKSGVLDAGTLKDLTAFTFDQRGGIAKQELELAKRQRELQKQMDLLQRKRNTLSSGSARTVREAVVFANITDPEAPRLQLRYLVGNATWSPSYNLRATTKREEVLVEYNASIQQMSGEDWTDVAMTLSTASPSLIAQAPVLDPLVVKLGRITSLTDDTPLAGAASSINAKSQLEAARRYLADQRGQGGANAAGEAPLAESTYDYSRIVGKLKAPQPIPPHGADLEYGQGDWATLQLRERELTDLRLNHITKQLQILDYNSARIERKPYDELPTLAGDGLSVSYQLASRMSLPSRSDRQLLQIAAHRMKGEFYHLALPVLTSSVFEEARLVNDSGQVLLAGPTSTFIGDEFVGRGELPTVAMGESFVVGLGVDSSLRTRRELVDREERIQGGNRLVDFTYVLSIENFGDEPVEVRLIDRMPTAGQADMKLTLLKSDKPVSDDQDFKQKGKKEGLLRWDVEVPAKATRTDRYDLKYTMQIEYDKQLSIVGLPAQE